MKKYLSLLCSVAIVALSLSGCSKNDAPDEDVQAVGVEKIVSFNATSPSTKSYFGEKISSGYPTVWTSKTRVSVSVNLANGKEATVNPKGSGNTATFDVNLTQPTADEFVFYALSPSSAVVSYSSTYKNIQVDVPVSQSPTKGSVDEASHIMFAKSSTFTEWPTETVGLNFSHLAAYGKFTLNNFREDGTAGPVKINSVDIESDSLIAGRFYFYPETSHFHPNPGTNIVTIKSDNIEYEHNNRDITFWFAVRPVDLSGSTMKITLNTSDGVFVKTFTFPQGKGNFQSGKVGTFEIDMDGINPQEEEIYTLVTDYSVLKEDAKVIIAAAEADFAISTTQQNNNRAGAVVTKSTENGVSVIKNPSSGVQIFVLEQGTLENTLAFNCENGDEAGKYIGSPGASNNYMKSFAGDSQEFTKGNCSFNVKLKEENSVKYAILKSKVNVDNCFMRFNSGSSNIFSLYTESSSVTGKVALYVLNGSGDGDPLVDAMTDDPVIEFDETTNTVTITCPDETARIGYSIDGSEPGIDDTGAPLPGTLEYTAPFVIEKTTTVKAFAGAEHKCISDVVTKVCTVTSGEPAVETIKITETWVAELTTTEGNNGKFLDDGAGVWVVNTYGRVAAKNASMSSFYSPKFDMSGITGGSITFMHTGNVTGSNYQNLGKAYYRINDGAWTQITLDNPSNNWAWMTATTNSTEYAGKTIQFKWEFQGNESKTWEVKQFKITVPTTFSYILDATITGGSYEYATESEITQNKITWKVMGNTTMSPWRLGGKSLTGENRALYSTTAINNNVNKIVITHGSATDITVNSMTVTVHNSANGAASGTSDVVATFTPTFQANGTVTITKSGTTSWAGCFYRIVYNVTVKETSNKFVEFSKAEFFFE